jgi:uncharacterized delta-60 repeat protein/uncharacterized repeat protein (TIGR01451 family)
MKRLTRWVVVAALAAFVLVLSGSVVAAPGDLDSTFGTGGLVTTDFGGTFNDVARAVLVQADGKIVAAGGSGEAFALVRYLADGSLDTGFGAGGKALTPTVAGGATDAVLYPDGKIAVGYMNFARYLQTGVLDEAFGSDGQMSLAFPRVFDDLELLADGGLLAAGVRYFPTPSGPMTQDFLVVRLTASGALDDTFGEGGIVTTDLGGSQEAASALVLLPEGKFLVVGSTYASSGSESDVVLLRYLADGSLDPTFGTAGSVVADLGGPSVEEYSNAALLTDDGRIVVAGGHHSRDTNTTHVTLARFLPSGSPDLNFGSGGLVTSIIGEARAVAQQADGKLVVTRGTSLAAIRFTPDGALDSTFGTGGLAGESSSGYGHAVALDASGNVIIAGQTAAAMESDFALARYLGDELSPGPFENDNFADAVSLEELAPPISTDNYEATQEPGEPPHGSVTGGASVWFSWTPSFSGDAFVSTEESDFDTTVGVYVGSTLASLVPIASNDDASVSTTTSRVCFSAQAGTQVRIAVDGYGVVGDYETSRGSITLAWGQYTGSEPCAVLPPVVVGVPMVGSALRAGASTWVGNISGYEVQWFACSPLGLFSHWIDGATGWVYTPTRADVGWRLAVSVIAKHPSDPALDLVAYSLPTAPVPAPPSSGGGGGGGGGQPPDLELTKAASVQTAAVGDTILYRLRARVKNAANASSVVVTDALPAGVELVSTKANRGPGCIGTTTLSCNLDFLSGQLVGELEIVVRVTQPGTLVNTATVTAAQADPDRSNNTASATVTVPERQPEAVIAGAKGVTRRGTGTANLLRGTVFADSLYGLAGNDRLFGLAGSDRLFGGTGNDRLFGAPGNDRLFGQVGNDLLNGGPGLDLLDAGAGNDTIQARDGSRDDIRCGAGKDAAHTDAKDRVSRDCEAVKRR